MSLPPPTQECVDAAVTSEERCDENDAVRIGKPEGVCMASIWAGSAIPSFYTLFIDGGMSTSLTVISCTLFRVVRNHRVRSRSSSLNHS